MRPGVQAGQPYGPINDELNGYWEGPFASIQEAEALNRELEKQPKIAAEFVSLILISFNNTLIPRPSIFNLLRGRQRTDIFFSHIADGARWSGLNL